MNRRIVTFAIGGPLRSLYMDLEVLPEENDSKQPAEMIILEWACEHFPLDWAATYSPEDFGPQIAQYDLKLLRKGRIEHFEGKNIFHEARQ